MTPAGALAALESSVQGQLLQAAALVQSQSFAVRLANQAGAPVNKAVGMVPGASGAIRRIVNKAMLQSLEVAVDSLEPEPYPPSSWLPKAMTGFTGGLGGLFGAVSLPIELPLTTTLMLRSIADIARHYGEDLSEIEARMACLEVFALGGGTPKERDELGYYAARAMFTKLTGDVVSYVVERRVLEASAPVVSRLVSAVASRFGVVVSERAAAAAIPVIGAIGGATLNVIFMNHFEKVAHGHFTLRRLERVHGSAQIRLAFDAVQRRR